MTGQQFIDRLQPLLDGQAISPDTTDEQLEETALALNRILEVLQNNDFEDGEVRKQHVQTLLDQCQAELNRRRGSDGMTPLTP